MKNKKIRLFLSGAIILILLLFVLYQLGIFSGEQILPGNKRLINVDNSGDFIVVEKKEIPQIYKTIGSIHSRNEIEISSRLTAKIKKLYCRSGDKVKENQIIAELENDDLLAAVNMVKKNIKSIEANIMVSKEGIKSASAAYKAATADFERSRTLTKSGNVSQKQYELSESIYRQTEAALREAELNLTKAVSDKGAAEALLKQNETLLSYSIIRSPVEGIVSEQLVELGDIAIPGKILFKIFDPNTLMLEMPIRESFNSKVKIGDKISFNIEALNEKLEGEIREIVPKVDSDTRTFMVKVCIGGNDKLVPGMYGVAEIEVGRENVLLVPDKAVKRIGQIETVELVHNGRIKKVFIRTIKSAVKGYKEVLSGLNSGDKVKILK